MKRIRFMTLTCAALLATAATAHAQAPDAPSAPLSVTPPKLTQASEPVYPEAKKSSAESASVGLVLTVDETGNVTNAEVKESAGAEFDQSALDAAKQLHFEAATRDGKPVAARIPFRFEFKFAPPPAPVEPAPAPAAVEPAPAQPAPAPAADAAAADMLEVEVEGQRPPREPTQRTLAAEEITKIPGTNGDALRSLGNMPGVARTVDGVLVVRGSKPQDTQVFVDGTSALMLYHLGGLSSVLPSEILERIDFYPGNFGPQYGRGMGGIVDVGVRSPKKDRIHGLLQFDSVDGRFLVEGPINESTRVMLAGRRSWLDAWLGPALRASGMGVTVAPVYYDYQAMVEHDLSRKTKLRLFAFGGDDRAELTLNQPDSSDPALGGSTLSHELFWRIQGRVDSRPSDNVRWTTTLSVGRNRSQQTIGDLFIDGRAIVLEGRSDVRAKILPQLTAVAGVDFASYTFDVGLRLPPIEFDGASNPGPLFGRPLKTLHTSDTVVRPAAYAMLDVAPVRGLKLLPGVRVDYDQATNGWTVDPRIGARYDVHPGYPRTTLKGGVGVFHQAPEPFESVKPFGNPKLGSNRAIHYSLGFEQEFMPPLELSVEGFYKDLNHLVASTPAVDSSEAGQTYANTGTGRVYGAEVLLRYKPIGPFFGWVAYTLSRSERREAPNMEKHLFEYDQTHILTALGSYKLGRGWQVGARFRYVSGRPYTPNLGGVVDYDAGVYSPIASPHQNSARLPGFQALDVRMDKTWNFKNWSLAFYVDVQNVYNHKNVEAQGDNYNYSKTTPTYGLPILPIVGFRGEI